MVLHLTVENAVVSTFEGDKGPVTMIQIVMTDKSKPAMFRTQTRFVINLMPDNYRKYFSDTMIEEEPLTVFVKDMSGSGTMIKLKGEIVKGWATQEQVEALARTRATLPPGSEQTASAAPASVPGGAAPAPAPTVATQKKAA